MKKTIILLFTILFSFSLFSCTSETTDSDKLIVAVSIVPQATWVEEIAGDLVDVVTLVPPGYSPGNYEPTARTMEDLEEAAVYFAIGVPTESANVLDTVIDLGIDVVYLNTIVDDEYDYLTLEAGGRDPHIWLSIKRVKVMVEAIADKLVEVDPDNALTYRSNESDYLDALDATNADIVEIFEDVAMKTFILYHPAFAYFADEYGLTMITLQENGQDASAQHYQDVVDVANNLNLEYIFYQEEIDSTQVQAFADEIDASIVALAPLSADYLDNLVVMANLIREALR